MGWDLREKIKEIPDQPGVYLFKDAAGKIIYIGKAKSLKKRLASYLSPAVGAKTGLMLSRAQDLELRLTSSESLALFLEAGLIRQFHPKYNVSRRDDKNFPLVKITHEEFPAVSVVRRRENDGSRYFGPYTSAKLLREALRTIRRSFPFRVHQELPEETRLYHKMGLSPASTLKEIDRREYSRNIRSLSLILNGRTEALVKKLTREMKMAAKARDFERAAVIRDQISALAALTSPRRGFTVND
ncbi:MAG: GIY-YIG nuclease family protein, partial [Candidatus Omnitrophota bacterium]